MLRKVKKTDLRSTSGSRSTANFNHF